jgi:hypothetical protein
MLNWGWVMRDTRSQLTKKEVTAGNVIASHVMGVSLVRRCVSVERALGAMLAAEGAPVLSVVDAAFFMVCMGMHARMRP